MSFWSDEGDEHQSIAEAFYRNIEYDHPDTISSDGQGSRWYHADEWYSSCVKYYKYNGSRVVNL